MTSLQKVGPEAPKWVAAKVTIDKMGLLLWSSLGEFVVCGVGWLTPTTYTQIAGARSKTSLRITKYQKKYLLYKILLLMVQLLTFTLNIMLIYQSLPLVFCQEKNNWGGIICIATRTSLEPTKYREKTA